MQRTPAVWAAARPRQRVGLRYRQIFLPRLSIRRRPDRRSL